LKREVLEMSYYISKLIAGPFDAAVDKVKTELKKEGFGVLTEIDVRKTLKEKMNVEFRNYRILGSCNPPFAYKALLAEDKIGLMLPCNVIVQETAGGRVEVAAIDPLASMRAVENPALEPIGLEVRAKLKKVVDRL
jgi:uncharacterized protein (DUF302 family)